MEAFTWNDGLDIGVDEMNSEHKTLIYLMNKLLELSEKHSSRKVIIDAFDQLIVFTKTHFADEEAFMAKIDYPERRKHIQLHESLIKKLEVQKAEFENSRSGKIPSAVFDFFKIWLTTHILIADKKYGDFFEESQRKSAKPSP